MKEALLFEACDREMEGSWLYQGDKVGGRKGPEGTKSESTHAEPEPLQALGTLDLLSTTLANLSANACTNLPTTATAYGAIISEET